MTLALLLIDLQNDYLAARDLQPCAGALCAAAKRLLEACRSAGVPVFHVQTTIGCDEDRMPHWKATGLRRCVEGTPGHRAPAGLGPRAGEVVLAKRTYTPFAGDALETKLRALRVDTVILAGLYLRACVRTAALDAYQRGFSVWIAEDAVADEDPVHAAVTQRYLSDRFASFRGVDRIARDLLAEGSPGGAPADESGRKLLPAAFFGEEAISVPGLETLDHVSPRNRRERLWSVPIGTRDEVSAAASAARDALKGWSGRPYERRVAMLSSVAERVSARADDFARRIVIETGKPIREARLELDYAVGLVRGAVRAAGTPTEGSGSGWTQRRRPQGVIAIITPWNNPLAIPLGKIAPALAHGNTVVWKPAPAGAALALSLLDVLMDAGLPADVVTLVQGDAKTAEKLMAERNVDAVTLTGSLAAGHAAQVICAGRCAPFQGELGGNNAAILWSDTDLRSAARCVAQGGFGSAGQRCTANRRLIVDETCWPEFLEALRDATATMQWGDPLDEETEVGPVISSAALQRIAAVVERAGAAGHDVFSPHRSSPAAADLERCGWYFPPTLVCCDDPAAEIVQEETFGPVMVVQRAKDWEHASALCNGVRQGLAAAVFTDSLERQRQFVAEARAGLLKINASTAGAAPDAPFGGWQASGVGPPEHGAADIEFYTRSQTIYGPPAAAPCRPFDASCATTAERTVD